VFYTNFYAFFDISQLINLLRSVQIETHHKIRVFLLILHVLLGCYQDSYLSGLNYVALGLTSIIILRQNDSNYTHIHIYIHGNERGVQKMQTKPFMRAADIKNYKRAHEKCKIIPGMKGEGGFIIFCFAGVMQPFFSLL